ncbi:MAG: glycosyltransferase family 2 protein [Candidatus Zixiibacteriota bacterium]|nr:MAG: glycosyltransferase family 2 protein [candidate division Zixibacteria bacterium]
MSRFSSLSTNPPSGPSSICLTTGHSTILSDRRSLLYHDHNIAVIIPALNEEQSISRVLQALPSYLDRVIVADNGSTDSTASLARQAGAEVISEPQRGYGAACLRAIAELDEATDIIVFLDGDYSDYPEETILLIDQIVFGGHEVVIGSRMIKDDARRHLTPAARFGNWLSTWLIRLFWRYRFTDLGPFRAVTYQALQRLNMQDRDFGWTVELQIKAAKLGLDATEVAVSYRPRIGRSKISGTVTGSVKAGLKILYLIFRELGRR